MASELGECVAARDQMGHSCWLVAGTLCGGEVQGTHAQKYRNCICCPVYARYNRTMGPDGDAVEQLHPEEEQRYEALLTELCA